MRTLSGTALDVGLAESALDEPDCGAQARSTVIERATDRAATSDSGVGDRGSYRAPCFTAMTTLATETAAVAAGCPLRLLAARCWPPTATGRERRSSVIPSGARNPWP